MYVRYNTYSRTYMYRTYYIGRCTLYGSTSTRVHVCYNAYMQYRSTVLYADHINNSQISLFWELTLAATL